MPILFCHGLESGPHGRKYHALVEAGFDVVAPDCRNRDLAARVDVIREAIVRAERPPLVVGSSFGGIAALAASILATDQGVEIPGLVLCAPALRLRQPPVDTMSLRCPAPTVIVHGTRDEVIPIDHSRDFAARHGARLIETDDDHRLAGSLDTIVSAVRDLLSSDR